MNKCPQNDVFFSPEYALVFEATRGETREDFGGEAQLFFYGDEQNYIIYPFFRRRVSELPFAELLPPESRDWLDIISPYGYSGPLAYVTEPKVAEGLWGGFLRQFHCYCVENNMIAEFARLHPFIKNHLPLQKFPDIIVKGRGRVVYVDLKQDESSIRKGMSRGNKSSIAKGHHSGVEVVRSKTKDDIDTFYRQYTHTMERNKARRSYFFRKDFFSSMLELLDGNVELFSARYKDRTIAAALFLFERNMVHYFLGASDADFLYVRPNNLLFYQAILWAKERGYEVFNLGGGYGGDDSLFRFKISFSKTVADFYTYSRVHNEEAYEILCQARDDYDRLSGHEAAEGDYFPKYRRLYLGPRC